MKKIFNFRPLFYGFIAIFIGIIYSQYIFQTNWIYIGVLIFLIATFLILSIIRKSIKTFIFILLFFSIGILGFFIDTTTYNVENFSGSQRVIGHVMSEKTTNNTQKIVLDNIEIDGKELDKNIYLTIWGAPYLSTGDIIQFTGNLNTIDAFYNGRIRSDFYKNNIRYTSSISGSNVSVLDSNKTFRDLIHSSVKEKLDQHMTEDNADIAFAILLGDRSEIDISIMQDYRTSGIAHILSISGLHVGIIVVFLYWLLRKTRCKNWISFIIITIILSLYCYLCGFASPVVRASIMSICLIGATLLGRKYDSLSAIGLAGILILTFNPFSALDVGFQLSFGCVIGISLFYKPLFHALRKIKIPRFIASPLSISIATQFFIFPIIISAFGGNSFLSVFLNVLVVPVFSVAYIVVFISTPLLFISSFFANFLWFSSLLLEWIRVCANFIASLKWSIIPQVELSLLVLLAFYSIVFISSNLVFLRPKTKLTISLNILLATSTLVGLTQII